MIRANGLSKRFGELTGVEDLSFDVREGEVFGFLGPNGAGKTTTVRLLTTLIAPTAGTATVCGYAIDTDDVAIRRSVGILTESPGFYDRLSAGKNLEIFARLYEVEDVAGQMERYLRMLGLWERRAEPVATFSRGMRQRLALCRALMHEPRILFLDEPTASLDPEATKRVHDFIDQVRAEGRTVFLCTHNLDEADRLCDRIGLIRQRLLVTDTPSALRARLFGRQVVFHLRCRDTRFEAAARRHPFVREVSWAGTRMVVGLDDPEERNPILVRALVEAGADVQFVGEIRRTLQDVYLSLVASSGHPSQRS
jgi:ABC-2 type transport system ATP-binding protein